MDILTLTEHPREVWRTILQTGEERLDDVLRPDDRDYLVEILTSEECMRFSPALVMDDVRLLVSHPQGTREIETLRWQKIAHQLLVTIGIFPWWIVSAWKAHQALLLSFHTAEDAFRHLAHLAKDRKEIARCERFQYGLPRYADVLMCSYELARRERLPFSTLRALASAGSKYAEAISSPRVRH